MSEGTALPVTTVVAIVGAGVMGSGIAQVAATAGHRVKIHDTQPGAAGKAVQSIGNSLDQLATRGRIKKSDADAAKERLTIAQSIEEVSDAGLVIEAIAEDVHAKRAVFAQLEQVVDEDCILATNTSSISVTAIGAGMRDPGRLVGMHFFNPPAMMTLVEVVSGLATASKIVDSITATVAVWGKVPVRARSTPGFIVNRCARPFYGEALRLLQEGAADCSTIDAVMREAGGFRMGPFELMDLIGNDINYAVTHSMFSSCFGDPRYTPSLIQLEMINAGFKGKKTGRGFYDYTGGARPEPSCEPHAPAPTTVVLHGNSTLVEALRNRLRANRGIAVQTTSDTADDRLMSAGGAAIYLTDGRSATQRASNNRVRNTVLVDLALDFGTASRIAMCTADQCSSEAWRAAVGLMQAAGSSVSRLDDVPGLAVMRTVAMLANEASEAVGQKVGSPAEIDLAMRKGVNYPMGPFEWVEVLGATTLVRVLRNLQESYGEDRYRVSRTLLRRLYAGEEAATVQIAVAGASA